MESANNWLNFTPDSMQEEEESEGVRNLPITVEEESKGTINRQMVDHPSVRSTATSTADVTQNPMAAAPALGQVAVRAVDANNLEIVDDIGHITATLRI